MMTNLRMTWKMNWKMNWKRSLMNNRLLIRNLRICCQMILRSGLRKNYMIRFRSFSLKEQNSFLLNWYYYTTCFVLQRLTGWSLTYSWSSCRSQISLYLPCCYCRRVWYSYGDYYSLAYKFCSRYYIQAWKLLWSWWLSFCRQMS